LRGADLVTGDSEELAAEVHELAPEVPWHPFIFGPPQDLYRAIRPTPRKTIVSLRRLTPEMRVSLAAEAFLHARQQGGLHGYRLAIAGDGPEHDAIASRFRDDSVEMLGQLQPFDLQQLLLSSEAVVSIPRTDGTSASLLEAMAAGALPIVNALPANLQWVNPEIGAVVRRDPTVNELASAMIRAGGWSIDREAIRDAVRPAEWETQIRGLLALYEAISLPSVEGLH